MKLIRKNNNEPARLSLWKAQNPDKVYDDLDQGIKQDIRMACATEQGFLCAYCCKAISGSNTDTLNEHIVPQSVDASRTLDFTNIVASCTTDKQCDRAKKNNVLPITPLLPNCETDLVFQLDGSVKGQNKAAKQTISILNLNNKALQNDRKRMIVGNFDEEDDDEFLLLLCEKILQPDENGRLFEYAPVVDNFIRNWLNPN